MSTIRMSNGLTDCGVLFHLQDRGDFAGEFSDIERFPYEILGAGFDQLSNFIPLDNTAYDNDLDALELGISSYRLADYVAVDVGQHVIEQYQLGPEPLGRYSRLIAARRRLGFEPAVPGKDVDYEFDNLRVVIDDKNLPLAGLDSIEGDLVFLHKLDETLARNPPKS